MRIVSGKLAHSMEQTTSLIVDILKTVNLEKTEFSVYAKLFDGEPVRRRSYPIHRIFMLVMNTYWDALKDKRVAVSIGGCKDRVMVDYDTIAASLVHLLDNATKYVCPGTKLIISFRGSLETVNLIMDMVSLRIQHDEINNIFYEGYSGREPKKIGLQGEGRGLFLVDRLLTLSDSKLNIQANVDQRRRARHMGMDFENNVFTMSMPRAQR